MLRKLKFKEVYDLFQGESSGQVRAGTQPLGLMGRAPATVTEIKVRTCDHSRGKGLSPALWAGPCGTPGWVSTRSTESGK